MGHYVCGNTLKENTSMGICLNNFKDDTLIVSKNWVKNHLDEIKEWMNS